MSQLTFNWDGVPRPESSGELAAKDTEAAGRLVLASVKAAERCRAAADGMEKHVVAKHASANRTLAQPPSRKRLQEADSQRREGTRLERIQRVLRTLAEMHESRTITAELTAITSKAAVERALFTAANNNTIRAIYDAAECPESKTARILHLTQEAMLMGIPGFFPTSTEVADDLVRFAGLETVDNVFEPSAGTGSLIDAVLKRHPAAHMSYCEINCFLLDVLRLKYEGIGNVHFVGHDFEEVDPEHFERRFDCIVLNPPFEHAQDIDQVLRAHRLLTRNGILAAIMPEGTFSRTDKKAAAFREFLTRMGATTIKQPANSFKNSGTAVQVRFARIPAQR